LRSLLEEVLAEAMPYLQNPEWLRWKLGILLGELAQPERLAEALEREARVEADPTRRTDLRIFLQYLRRRLKA